MGTLFCSYYVNNRISRVRRAIQNSELDDLKKELEDMMKNEESHDMLNTSIDSNGNTPLTLAIESRQIKSFNYILEKFKIDVNKSNEYTLYSPLHMCCITPPYDQKNTNFRSKKSTKLSKSLEDLSKKDTSRIDMSKMANLSEENLNKKRPKNHKLALNKKKSIYGSVDSAIDSIDSSNSGSKKFSTSFVKVDQKPIDSETLTTFINSLIDKGADLNNLVKVNKLTQMPGFELIRYVTPLHVAVYNQNLTAINLLIKNGCNVNQCDPVSKISPLHMACYMSKIEIVSALLHSQIVDIEFKSRNGFNGLHWLAISENDENSFGIALLLLSNLIKKYESIYESNSSDLLHVCDLHVKNFVNQLGVEYSQTALMFACMKNKLNLIKILLDYDADVDLKDKNGKTACDYGKSNESCVYLLNSFNKLKKITMKKKKSNNSVETIQSSVKSNIGEILSVKSLEFDHFSISSLINGQNDLYKTSF